MAGFEFSLEGVLRQRKHVEQQRMRELAVIQGQMAELDAQLRVMDQSVKATTEDVRQNRLVGRLDLSFLAAHRLYTFSMQRKAMELMQKMAGVQRLLDEARKALGEAAKRRKAIEKLREARLAEWREKASRREAAEMDEIGMQLSFRAMNEGEAAAQ
jgi:flagellar FliJ protein